MQPESPRHTSPWTPPAHDGGRDEPFGYAAPPQATVPVAPTVTGAPTVPGGPAGPGHVPGGQPIAPGGQPAWGAPGSPTNPNPGPTPLGGSGGAGTTAPWELPTGLVDPVRTPQPAPAPPPPGAPVDRERRGRGAPIWAAALIGALVAAVVAALMWTLMPRENTTIQNVNPASKVSRQGLDIPTLLAKVRPSVVAIQTGATTARGFEEAAGSGIVLSKDGLVLTNAHVIEGANRIEVTFSDGSSHSATLVGALADNDVALVKADGISDATPATLGSSDAAQVGDDVVAIGNALNLGEQPTVTLGIISALDRTISAENVTLDHLIQTDAAINPGNSGGPLVNAKGEVIGMNTAIIQNSQSLGFSLAIDDIKPLIEELKQGKGSTGGQVAQTAFLGVQTTDISETTPDVLDRFQVTVDHGAFVQAVTPGSAADRAGVRPGDVIIGVDGQEIQSNQQVGAVIRKKQPGDDVQLKILRQGSEQTVTATLGSR